MLELRCRKKENAEKKKFEEEKKIETNGNGSRLKMEAEIKKNW